MINFLNMKVLEIRQPYIKRTGNKSRLCSDISWGDRSRTLWFEVEREYEECLCTERIDSFLVALLPYAMIENLNIHSDGYVSEKLLYQLYTLFLVCFRFIPKYSIQGANPGWALCAWNIFHWQLNGGIILGLMRNNLECIQIKHAIFKI